MTKKESSFAISSENRLETTGIAVIHLKWIKKVFQNLGKLSSNSVLAIALIVMAAQLIHSDQAFADRSDRRDRENEEYNFNWLDPEKKIYVLQNRKYEKTGHPLLSVMGGIGFSNPYRDSYTIDPRFAYYMSEGWGIELFYTATINSPNNTFRALSIAAPNTLPSIREIRAQYGAQIHWVPWYAKINVFNSILYFDWYFGVGAGSVQSFVNTTTTVGGAPNFAPDNLLGIFLSTGHQYHLSQHFVVRLDITSVLYQANINGLTGDTSWFSNINIGAGLGLRL